MDFMYIAQFGEVVCYSMTFMKMCPFSAIKFLYCFNNGMVTRETVRNGNMKLEAVLQVHGLVRRGLCSLQSF